MLALQSTAGNAATAGLLGVQRDPVEVSLIVERDEWTDPRGQVFRLGQAHGHNVLMKIEDTSDRGVLFHWFNFYNGVPVTGRPQDWEFLALGDIGGTASTQRFTALGRQLPPAQWRALWPNPVPRLLAMVEAGQIRADDEVIVSAHRGQVASEARSRLDANEAAVSGLLGDAGRVDRLEEYVQGLREAALVRDRLAQHKQDVDRQLSLAQQQPYIGLPMRPLLAGLSGPQRLRAIQQQAELGEAIAFWNAAFPLLSRLRTEEINTARVRATLETIRGNIQVTRTNLVGTASSRPTLDPWNLGGVRADVDARLGPRARGAVAAEDRSRSRGAVAGAVGMTALGIALIFVPGGLFVDALIGVAIAEKEINEAAAIGRAANTGMHVDDGLMTQGQASGARFRAVLSTVFAAVGAAASGLRVLRLGRAFAFARAALPELELAGQMRLAKALAGDTELVTRLGAVAANDAAVLPAVRSALREFPEDTARLSQVLRAVVDGYRGPARDAWTHGLHADAVAALAAAAPAEREAVRELVQRSPADAEGILRQFLYKSRKAPLPPGSPALDARLRDALGNLAEVRGRSYPFGFANLAAFQRFGQAVRDAARRYGVHAADVRVHGSAVHKRVPGDIDVAIVVERTEFDALTRQFIGATQPRFSRLRETIAHEAAAGKIPYNRFAPREANFSFGSAVHGASGGTHVQVSLILRGGPFDVGPYLPIP